MTRSCFDSIKLNSTNIVFIQSGSNLVENENNFVRNIEANNATDICEGIFVESPGSDCVQNLPCEGVCMLMNGSSCLAGTNTNLSSKPSMSSIPSTMPSKSSIPTTSHNPTEIDVSLESPSTRPSITVTSFPSFLPSISSFPTNFAGEVFPSSDPSSVPKNELSSMPSSLPSMSPRPSISARPSIRTSLLPSHDPTSAPSCYDNTSDLVKAIDILSITTSSINTIRLCPRTIFDFDRLDDSSNLPLRIERGSLTFQCGELGLRSDECVIFGGIRQFEVGTALEVNFVGITFVGATIESVTVTRLSSSSILFMNCIFAVSIYIYTHICPHYICESSHSSSLCLYIINAVWGCMTNFTLIFSHFFTSSFFNYTSQYNVGTSVIMVEEFRRSVPIDSIGNNVSSTVSITIQESTFHVS